MQNPTKFIRSMTDTELRDLESAVRKERRRRKKIVSKNDQWTCGEGLLTVLAASLLNGGKK